MLFSQIPRVYKNLKYSVIMHAVFVDYFGFIISFTYYCGVKRISMFLAISVD